MPLDLDELEQRIVGVLIEKELTVPDGYPLTTNALVAGCNQKSNRDPTMAVESYEVEGALRSLMDKDWVTRREAHGSRTLRYAHEARQQLGVDEAALALLAELLCRGPQAPGYLKTRASRMHPFASPEEVEAVLRGLAERPVPYAERLPRQPRERGARWRHCLGKAGAAPPAAAAEAAPRAATEGAPRPAPAPPAAAGPSLAERVERLEREVAALRARLDAE
jgi:uncharacterized protein YceH (UPF0502 family)